MFDICDAQQRLHTRLTRSSRRRRRADAGRSRLPAAVLDEIQRASAGFHRPPIAALQRRVAERCAREGVRTPSRASLYNALPALAGHFYRVLALPPAAAATLYNLEANGTVPGRQLVFYCLNYGPLDAVSFAAGLPWLDLYQAQYVRGWRPRSRGLLAAILHLRDAR